MINREWQDVEVLWYSSDLDEYGQKRQSEPTVQTVEMVCKIYSQTNVTDPRYIDIDVIGLVDSCFITDKNEVRIKENPFNIPVGEYQVRYVIPSTRYTQVLMKRK